jgi:Contractile injection system tube protein
MSDNSTIPNSGSVSKLIIHCYEDKNFKKKKPNLDFSTPINPESFSKNYSVNLDTRVAHGQPSTDAGYKSSTPETLKLDFVLDGTGVVQGYLHPKDTKSVHDELQAFLKCAYTFDGVTHRPNYLIIYWGTEINFHCVLSSVDINHTLFLPDGSPLRVKISATFTKTESDATRAAKTKQSSPDLTHQRVVQQGDRLDWLTNDIYTDPNYFLMVARSNGLTTVRKLQPGSKINFPPLPKS